MRQASAADKQRHYQHLRRKGILARHARRLATGLFFGIGLSTNATFMAGRDDGFGTDERRRKRHRAKARAAGVNPTGKVWSPQLNEWYGNKDDVMRICKRKGMSCEGMVNVKAPAREVPDPGPYRVADSLVNEEVTNIVNDKYEDQIGKRELADLMETTRERLTGVTD